VPLAAPGHQLILSFGSLPSPDPVRSLIRQGAPAVWSWFIAHQVSIYIVSGITGALSLAGYAVRKGLDPVFICAAVAALHRDKARRDDARAAMRDLLGARGQRRRSLPPGGSG
jgi:hypothetical protein